MLTAYVHKNLILHLTVFAAQESVFKTAMRQFIADLALRKDLTVTEYEKYRKNHGQNSSSL